MNIKEASQQINLSPDTIRYYEKIGLVPRINRRENGIRNFSPEDLCWLSFAKEMRDSGLSIDASIKYIHLYDVGGDETIDERKTILFEQKQLLQEKVDEMQASIHALNNRMNHIEELESNTCEVVA